MMERIHVLPYLNSVSKKAHPDILHIWILFSYMTYLRTTMFASNINTPDTSGYLTHLDIGLLYDIHESRIVKWSHIQSLTVLNTVLISEIDLWRESRTVKPTESELWNTSGHLVSLCTVILCDLSPNSEFLHNVHTPGRSAILKTVQVKDISPNIEVCSNLLNHLNILCDVSHNNEA